VLGEYECEWEDGVSSVFVHTLTLTFFSLSISISTSRAHVLSAPALSLSFYLYLMLCVVTKIFFPLSKQTTPSREHNKIAPLPTPELGITCTNNKLLV
jgi:hypothetical protein